MSSQCGRDIPGHPEKGERKMNQQEFMQKQSLPYEAKVNHATQRAWEFYETVDNCHVSVGGLDSITLLIWLRSIGIDIPAISVSQLEDKSIQRIHDELGVIKLKPIKSKARIIQEEGFLSLVNRLPGRYSCCKIQRKRIRRCAMPLSLVIAGNKVVIEKERE